jgi:hypothetical protein
MSAHSKTRQVRRFLSITAAAGAILIATTSVAFAEVITVGHTTFTNVVTNPCDLADGPIALTTDSYFVFKAQPDGSFENHIVFHSQGVSGNGTQYVANRVSTQTAEPGSTIFAIDVHLVRISAGPGDNAMITITGPLSGPMTMTVRCVG